MSDLSKSIKSYLLTFPALREHVANRIHFDFLPAPGKGVSIVIEETFGDHEHQLSGAAGIYSAEARITVYSHDPLLRTTVAEIVRDKLQGFRGTAGSEFIHSCELSFRDKRVIPGDQFGVRSI
jgi:hypothetical protein